MVRDRLAGTGRAHGLSRRRAKGRTVVLLHGKNFCAATWGETIGALATRGYRVIAPDQIGFCKSSKPQGYQYSFHAMATLTGALLDQAGVERSVLVGHSTGGILASRFALMMPGRVERLVLVNPLGLTEAKGCPMPIWVGFAQRKRKPMQRPSGPISSASIMTAPGAPNMAAGSRCWPANMRARMGILFATPRRDCRT
nr:alpha/beta hydrolase [Sandaracinobacteroides sayramensis]